VCAGATAACVTTPRPTSVKHGNQCTIRWQLQYHHNQPHRAVRNSTTAGQPRDTTPCRTADDNNRGKGQRTVHDPLSPAPTCIELGYSTTHHDLHADIRAE
jgi:hypothetical protein